MAISYNYGQLRANLDIRADLDETLGSPVNGMIGALNAIAAKNAYKGRKAQKLPKSMNRTDVSQLRDFVGMPYSGLTLVITD